MGAAGLLAAVGGEAGAEVADAGVHGQAHRFLLGDVVAEQAALFGFDGGDVDEVRGREGEGAVWFDEEDGGVGRQVRRGGGEDGQARLHRAVADEG